MRRGIGTLMSLAIFCSAAALSFACAQENSPELTTSSDAVSGGGAADSAGAQTLDSERIIVRRLPWRVRRGAVDPVSGNVLLLGEQSPDIWHINQSVLDTGSRIEAERVAIAGQPHQVVVRQTPLGARFVVRMRQGDLYWIDADTLQVSSPLQLGPASVQNRGFLRVGSKSNLVYTTQSAGLHDPSVPTSLVAVNVAKDPPAKIEVRGSRKIATSEQFVILDDEAAVVAVVNEDQAAYIPLTIGTLGKPGENYLRASANVRYIPTDVGFEDASSESVSIITAGAPGGIVMGRRVWSPDVKRVVGTLNFSPLSGFMNQPWVAGLANLNLRVASLRSATTIGSVTLPSEMLRGLPHNDAIDEIGLPYAPIEAIVMPDFNRNRILVIIGDHLAVVPIQQLGLPHPVDAAISTRHYQSEKGISQYSVSPDGRTIATLAGNPNSVVAQTFSLYRRSTARPFASRTFKHKIVSIALANDFAYVVDIDGYATRLSLKDLVSVNELGLRCKSLRVINDKVLLADESQKILVGEGSIAQRREQIDSSFSLLADRRLDTGYLIDGAYHAESLTPSVRPVRSNPSIVNPAETAGGAQFVFEASDFIGTQSPSHVWDVWDSEYPDSLAQQALESRTREAGTLLCPPVRSQSIPIQVTVVKSVIGKESIGETEASPTNSTQAEVILEARNLVDGRLVKRYPLFRESFDPSYAGCRLAVEATGTYVLHHGTLIDVDLEELNQASFPRPPSIVLNKAPVVIPLERKPLLTYQLRGGMSPVRVSVAADTMSDRLPPKQLVPISNGTNSSTQAFHFDFESWLQQNLSEVGNRFDEFFDRNEGYDANGDTIENLRRYISQRGQRILAILGRNPKGIPIAIGMQIIMTDASRTTTHQHHYVFVELPVKSLVAQIDRAKSLRVGAGTDVTQSDSVRTN